MEQKKILAYAYYHALQVWDRERERLESLPDNEYSKARERKAWEEMMEISQMLYNEEHKTA